MILPTPGVSWAVLHRQVETALAMSSGSADAL